MKIDKPTPGHHHPPSVQERILRSKHHFEVIQYNKAHHLQRVAKNQPTLSSNVTAAIPRYHMRYNSHEYSNPGDYVHPLDRYPHYEGVDTHNGASNDHASQLEQKRMYEMQRQQQKQILQRLEGQNRQQQSFTRQLHLNKQAAQQNQQQQQQPYKNQLD